MDIEIILILAGTMRNKKLPASIMNSITLQNSVQKL